MRLLNFYSAHLYTTHRFHAHFHTINILNFTILFPRYTLNSSREEQFKDSYIRLSGLTALIQIWYQFSSVAQSCLILCDLMDCSKPGLPVPYHHPKFAQVHIHCISDAVQPPFPLTPSSPSALYLCSIRDFSSESAVTSDEHMSCIKR